MRFFIVSGMLFIADAIRPGWSQHQDGIRAVIICVLTLGLMFDVIELFGRQK